MTSFENCTYIAPPGSGEFAGETPLPVSYVPGTEPNMHSDTQPSENGRLASGAQPRGVCDERSDGDCCNEGYTNRGGTDYRMAKYQRGGALFPPKIIPNFTAHTIDDPRLNKIVESFNSDRFVIFPGLCDVHVHFREPGLTYKETIASGCAAAAHGGFTAVGAMPNLNPVPDSLDNLAIEEAAIARDATIAVIPYGSITIGEKGERLSDIAALASRVLAFSDDGVGVQSAQLMREAMVAAKEHGKIIAAHCEDAQIKGDGYINDGDYARMHGHLGVPVESEWRELERDLELARDTGAALHVCHVSCIESFDLVRAAKADGIDVTCETAPHYLTLDDSMLEESGRFKMNPPLRSPKNREALIEALADGTVDMIATDHAPHSADEKSRGLAGSSFGIVGLETSFPVLYTKLVLPGVIDLERLIDLMAIAPRKRFGIPLGNDFTIWDLGANHEIDPSSFLSLGRSTPFEGWNVYGKCKLTVFNGRVVWIDADAELLGGDES